LVPPSPPIGREGPVPKAWEGEVGARLQFVEGALDDGEQNARSRRMS
jgi:hypothetical protein